MEDAVQSVARNLARYRLSGQMSLSELARRSGVAKATISQLEAGIGNPTIETLLTLSTTLGVSLGDLILDGTERPAHVIRANEGTLVSGTAVDLRFVHRFPAGFIELYDMRVRPGEVQRSEGHAGIEHIHVVHGRMSAGASAQVVELGPGDYVSFDASVPHEYSAHRTAARATLLIQYPLHGPVKLPPPSYDQNGS